MFLNLFTTTFTYFHLRQTGLFIKLLDSFSFSPMYRCLVFERMFCSLDDLISRNPPSLPQIGVIFYQLLQALKVLKVSLGGGQIFKTPVVAETFY